MFFTLNRSFYSYAHTLWVASKGIGTGEGSGRMENAADKAGRRWQTGNRGPDRQRSMQNLCLLCFPYHKLLRLPRRCFCCAPVFLSFPFALGRALFSRADVLFCLPHLRGGTTPHSLFYFIFFSFFLSCFFVSFVFLSVNAS